ncbi:MAG: hypothetical protein EOO88_41195 [Pedobacter sp.]|nr:MAG: hypothetical protein EOO88_41195 [Pedobacter sp.]
MVRDNGEQGFLSMAFHPNYPVNGNINIARFQVSADPNIADPGSDTVLLSIPKPYTNHNGGHLQFKPGDSTPYMYFATGDGGDANNPENSAQIPSSQLGKMLRMNVDAPGPTITPELWAMGLRNPFRWSFDRSTGDMWIGDVGQGQREEINFRPNGTAGANYGWPCVEGTLNNGAAPGFGDCDTVRAIDFLPIHEYQITPTSRSVVGGYVYRGTEYANMQGVYFFTDYFSTSLSMIRPNGMGGWTVTSKPGLASGTSSISEGADGSLFVTSLNNNSVSKIIDLVVTPVHLTSFSGKVYSGYHELKWIVQDESAIQKYIVDWSTDGINYQQAGEVQALNTTNTHAYSFRHNNATARKVFYRIRIVSMDGTAKYSPVITLGDAKGAVQVYPTIVKPNGTVNIITQDEVNTIRMIGTDGRMVASKIVGRTSGYISFQVPGSVAAGTYIIQLEGDNVRQAVKVVVE